MFLLWFIIGWHYHWFAQSMHWIILFILRTGQFNCTRKSRNCMWVQKFHAIEKRNGLVMKYWIFSVTTLAVSGCWTYGIFAVSELFTVTNETRYSIESFECLIPLMLHLLWMGMVDDSQTHRSKIEVPSFIWISKWYFIFSFSLSLNIYLSIGCLISFHRKNHTSCFHL